MAAGRRPSEQLSALVGAFVLWHTREREVALIGASEIRSLDAVGRKLVVTLRDEQQRMFDDVIDRGVSEGDFTTPYPREAARAIINMAYSIATWYNPAGDVSPDEMAERYAVLALGIVGAHPSSTQE
nr:hypothetical protein [Nocardioides daedukensis]